MRSMRITDGEAHPMRMSLSGHYAEHWPFQHPALQIWWLALGLLGFAIWLATRD